MNGGWLGLLLNDLQLFETPDIRSTVLKRTDVHFEEFITQFTSQTSKFEMHTADVLGVCVCKRKCILIIKD